MFTPSFNFGIMCKIKEPKGVMIGAYKSSIATSLVATSFDAATLITSCG
jgi:hypothetical protein